MESTEGPCLARSDVCEDSVREGSWGDWRSESRVVPEGVKGAGGRGGGIIALNYV